MNEINLAPGRSVEVENQFKQQKIVKILALCSIICVGLISIIFFAITLLLPINAVKNSQNQTLQGISQLHQRIVTVVLTQDRVHNIQILLNKRKDYPQIVNQFMTILPSDLTVTQMILDNGSLSITVTGASLMSMNDYINGLIDSVNKNSKISNFSIQSLVYNSDLSVYRLTFQADIL